MCDATFRPIAIPVSGFTTEGMLRRAVRFPVRFLFNTSAVDVNNIEKDVVSMEIV